MISQKTKLVIGADKEIKNQYKKIVLEFVSLIPYGKITSFGRIGYKTGISPRVVGFILSGMTKREMGIYPWFRVVDRNGFISSIKMGEKGLLQKALLEKEGVEIEGFQIMGVERYWWEWLS